jgi:hypothetical protein
VVNSQHAGLKNAKDEADTTDAVNIMNERSTNRCNTEAERDARDKPAWTNPFAGDV